MKRSNNIHRWTKGDFTTLLLECRNLDGQVGTVGAQQFWRAYLLVAWDTGERNATLLRLQSDWVDWNLGAIRIPGEVQKPVDAPTRVIRLQAETLAALRMIFDSGRERLFDVSRVNLFQGLQVLRQGGVQ